jgi:chromosomal replication initiation ATPase DnaA
VSAIIEEMKGIVNDMGTSILEDRFNKFEDNTIKVLKLIVDDVRKLEEKVEKLEYNLIETRNYLISTREDVLNLKANKKP